MKMTKPDVTDCKVDNPQPDPRTQDGTDTADIYHVADMPTLRGHPMDGGPVEVTPISATWDDLVDHVIDKDRDIRARDDIPPSKDGVTLIPSKLEPMTHPRRPDLGEGYWRLESACDTTQILCLDVEDHPIGDQQSDVLSWFHDLFDPTQRALIYTTYSHGVRRVDGDRKWKPGHPRIRVIMPLSRPVDSQTEYPHLWEWVTDYIPGVDEGTGDPSRGSYTYRDPHPDAELDPWHIESGMNPLDPDNLPTENGQTTSVRALKREHEQRQQERKQRRQQRAEQLQSGILEGADQDSRKEYLRSTLKGVVADILDTPEGSRNDTLLSKSTKIGAMLRGVDVDTDMVRDVLIEAGQKSGLPQSESERTTSRGLRYGITQADPFDWTRIASVSDDVVAKDFDGPPDDPMKVVTFEAAVADKGGDSND